MDDVHTEFGRPHPANGYELVTGRTFPERCLVGGQHDKGGADPDRLPLVAGIGPFIADDRPERHAFKIEQNLLGTPNHVAGYSVKSRHPLEYRTER